MVSDLTEITFFRNRHISHTAASGKSIVANNGNTITKLYIIQTCAFIKSIVTDAYQILSDDQRSDITGLCKDTLGSSCCCNIASVCWNTPFICICQGIKCRIQVLVADIFYFRIFDPLVITVSCDRIIGIYCCVSLTVLRTIYAGTISSLGIIIKLC